VADGDLANHTSVKAEETAGVSFYGSWQETWRPTDYDACGRGPAFIASAFAYDAERDLYLCPAGDKLTYYATYNDSNGCVDTHTDLPNRPAAAARTVISVLPKRRQPAGDERLHASKNRLRRLHSKPG
jgi:hypothetical protein